MGCRMAEVLTTKEVAEYLKMSPDTVKLVPFDTGSPETLRAAFTGACPA